MLPRQSLYLNLDLGYLSMKHSILEALKSGRDTKRPLDLAQDNLCDGDKLGKLPTRETGNGIYTSASISSQDRSDHLLHLLCQSKFIDTSKTLCQ